MMVVIQEHHWETFPLAQLHHHQVIPPGEPPPLE